MTAIFLFPADRRMGLMFLIGSGMEMNDELSP